jgi:hypothetical protein
VAGLAPAIHVFLADMLVKTWMPGTRPGMTNLAVVAFCACPPQNISKYSRCSQSDISAWKRSISAFLMWT